MIIDIPADGSTTILADIARQMGIDVDHDVPEVVNSRRFGGRVLRFDHARIRPLAGSDQFRSYSDEGPSDVDGSTRMIGRRKNAICWHGHREWMRGILRTYPSAIIDTGLATYRGADDFEETHEQTHPRERSHGYRLSEACRCDDN